MGFLINPFIEFPTANWDWEDDFTSYGTQGAFDTAYPTTDTGQIRGNPDANKIDAQFVRTGSSDLMNHDVNAILGENLSDSAWIFRTPYDITNLNTGGNPQGAIGFSSNTADYNTNQDGIFFGQLATSGTAFRFWDPDAESLDGSLQDAMSTTITVALRYVQMIRLTTTKVNVSFSTTDAYDKDVDEKEYTINSTTGGLSQFKILNNNSGNVGGSETTTLEYLQLNNGVTTPP